MSKEQSKDISSLQYFNDKKKQFEELCANENDKQACFSLGEYYQLIDKNLIKASQIYDTNCFKNNHGNSCFNLATLYLSSKIDISKIKPSESDELNKISTTRERALYLSQKSCNERDNSQSCGAYCTLLLSNYKLDKNKEMVTKALNIFEDMCINEKDPNACARLSLLSINGGSYDIKHDAKKAIKFAKLGCDEGNHPQACHTLSVIYGKGDGIEKNEKLSKKYKEKTLKIIKETSQAMGVDEVIGLPKN